MSGVWQVASFILHVHPERVDAVTRTLTDSPGVQIRAVEGATLIVVVEGDDDASFAQRAETLRTHPEVLAANLVFHQFDFDEES